MRLQTLSHYKHNGQGSSATKITNRAKFSKPSTIYSKLTYCSVLYFLCCAGVASFLTEEWWEGIFRAPC